MWPGTRCQAHLTRPSTFASSTTDFRVAIGDQIRQNMGPVIVIVVKQPESYLGNGLGKPISLDLCSEELATFVCVFFFVL